MTDLSASNQLVILKSKNNLGLFSLILRIQGGEKWQPLLYGPFKIRAAQINTKVTQHDHNEIDSQITEERPCLGISSC